MYGKTFFVTESDVGTDIDSKTTFFFDNTIIQEDTGWYNNGTIEWITGDNSGIKMDIKTHNKETETIELFLPMPYNIKVGDQYKITSGCNHMFLGSDGTIATGDCITKYNNGVNFRGQPHTPTEDTIHGGVGAFGQ